MLLLTAWVWFGVRRGGGKLRDLFGTSSWRWTALLGDLGLGFGLLVATVIAYSIFKAIFPAAASPDPLSRSMAAVPWPLLVMFVLSTSVCAEIIFRGYLQRQFAALTNGAAGGIGVRAVIFGLSCGSRGPRRMFCFAITALLGGLLVHWRRSLRPNIVSNLMYSAVLFLVARSATS